jgi:asparagine synthase (glutamine-hydrolysing)
VCGIAGIFTPIGVTTDRLGRMSELLRHRGPDDEGFVLIDREGQPRHHSGADSVEEIRSRLSPLDSIPSDETSYPVGLVHRRLSILDLSAAGHQPMLSASGRFVLAYNGEVYNYLELRAELESDGARFHSGTDTEVILAAWEAWGPACLEKFVGMWAFCIWDMHTQEAFLVRDRFGIKPLYYKASDGTFVFSSELKAIIQTETDAPHIDRTAVAEFLFYGKTTAPSGNLFDGIEELPEGSFLRYSLQDQKCTMHRYYQFGAAGSIDGQATTAETSYATFSEYLNRSIELHLRSDVPVGVCLSGGLDSSYIAAYLAANHPGIPLKTFTAGYRDKDVDESHLALMIRDRYPSVDATVVYPAIETTWSSLDRQIYHHDLPFHSSSMFAQWAVMESVRDGGIKVVMNGQGADEVIGGYYTFAGQHLLDLLLRFRLLRFLRERKELRAGFSKHVEKDILRALYNYLPAQMQKKARSKSRVGAKLLRPEYSMLLGDGQEDSRRRRGYRGMTIESVRYGLQQLLRYEDRISMAFSIESRVPFLDHRFAEHVLSMRSDWKIREGWTKYPLRRAGEGLVPENIRLRRDKMGFLTPAQRWLGEKQSEIVEAIAGSPIRSVIDPEMFEALGKKSATDPTHVSETWKVYVLARWLDIFNVRL